ncbi:FAR1 DNA binding domain, Zinc finger, SWIM-type, MULE transposase domain, FHY3/FAR1 family [Artemisia annua]|uniref:FAR1 DNA binding domain, Zinc finger, SWIM-type, MULE transposase domain, FHY3/FAR1 family n=1 Tax=Artemisia annua TaxID=35608 RepID=A0A2U1LQP6_ARTAN|nr:FAR1 DNA binding domain, Zinc finger, SWIM-type, MULE transposase domain, FHY3/FAR1 family [Artemisia annua]
MVFFYDSHGFINVFHFVGEPLTPRAGNNEPRDVFGASLFTPPHDHQVGSFQPTPNSTKYWVPKVINKPVEGQVFDTLELALNAYKDYAREGGFEPGNQKAGKPQPTNPLGVTKVIKRRLKKQPDGKYRVSKFIEKHNHSLVYEDDVKYLSASRRLTFSKKQLLNQLSNVNIGPVRSWKVLKEIKRLYNYLVSPNPSKPCFDYPLWLTLVGPALCSDMDFKRRLCGIIWTDRIEPEDEIFESLFHCGSLSVQEDDESLTYMIRDIEADYTTIHGVSVEAKYEVKYVPASCDIKCSCLKYECYGLLCHHIFYVLRLSKVFHFPRKYLQRRWSKYALPNKIVTRPVDVASLSNPVECVNGVLREIYDTVEDSVTRLVTDIQKLHIYKADLDTLLEQVKIDIPNAPEMSKKELYAAALGVKEPETVNIVAPECRNKGSVSLKRH